MRVVLINELYIMGGAEMQTRREKCILEDHHHTVMLITFDPSLGNGWIDKQHTHWNFLKTGINSLQQLYEKFYGDKKKEITLRKLLSDFAPDVIHLNNTVDNAITILNGIRGYSCVQTIRDYSIICPTGLCVDKEYKVCEGYSCHQCLQKCKKVGFIYNFKLYLKLAGIKKLNKFRKVRIRQFLCPSQALTDKGNEYGFDTKCVNNPFDFSLLENSLSEQHDRVHNYIYYGYVAKHKGVCQLIKAFNEFSEDKEVTLYIAGKLNEEFKDEFQQMVQNAKIKYMGVLSYKDTIMLLEKMDVVVVPSLWIENYPNTALEGIASHCLVLGSNRGGTKELIQDDRFVFDVMDHKEIIKILEHSYNLSKEERKNITDKNYQRIHINNSIEKYYTELIKVFQNITRK